MGMGDQGHALVASTSGKGASTHFRGSRSGRTRKNSPRTGIRKPDHPESSKTLCRVNCPCQLYQRSGADKFLARPGRKQVTATKLGIYSTYSPRSSIHFLAHCSNFCKQLKKNPESCPSNQVHAAADRDRDRQT
jgi:hypothetical protein